MIASMRLRRLGYAAAVIVTAAVGDVAGCAVPPSAVPPSAVPPSAVPAGGVAPSGAAPEARLPGPGPQLRGADYDVVASNAGCVRCHGDIAAEWRASQHRSAWDDPVFLAAFALEPLPFCRRCHAPEVDEGSREPDPSRHLGVGCVTCHVLSRDVLGTRNLAGTVDAHPVMRDARLAETAWCSGCHQFDFEEPQEAAMQSTVDEHQQSQHRDRTCQDCHMPRVDDGGRGHRSHRFRVQGDAAFLRSGVEVVARRTGARSIAVTLRVTAAGHAVPTGDMFRRLEVRARAGDVQATPVVLARAFRKQASAHGTRRVQVADTRLRADGVPAEAALFFSEAIDSHTVTWQVVYQRMGPAQARLFGVDIAREETVLASGIIEGQTP